MANKRNKTKDLKGTIIKTNGIIKTLNIINLNLITKRAIQETPDKKIISSV